VWPSQRRQFFSFSTRDQRHAQIYGIYFYVVK
jgi:hypothetical protein